MEVQLKRVDPIVKPSLLRFYILIVYCLIQFFQAIQFTFYTAIPSVICDAYVKAHVTTSTINLVVSLSSVATLVAIPFMVFFDNYFSNMRILILICCAFVTLGIIIRVIPHWVESQLENAPIFMTFSSICISVSNVFSNALQSLVSATWFPLQERVIATGLGSQALTFGNALTYLLIPIIVNKADRIEPTLNTLLILQVVISLAVLIYFPARPKYYPSISQVGMAQQEEEQFLKILDSLKTDSGAVDGQHASAKQEEMSSWQKESGTSVSNTSTTAEGSPLLSPATVPLSSPASPTVSTASPPEVSPSPTGSVSSQARIFSSSSSTNNSPKAPKLLTAREMVPKKIRAKLALRPVITILRFFIDPHMLLFGICGALWYGTMACWGLEIPILYLASGFSGSVGSTVAFVSLIINAFGAMGCSTIAQRFPRNEKKIIIIVACINLAFSILFNFIFGWGPTVATIVSDSGSEQELCHVPWRINTWVVSVICCVNGIFAIALMPILFDVAAQMGYPLSAGATGGFMFACFSIGIAIVPFLFSAIGTGYINLITSTFLFVMIILSFFLKLKYNRSDFEEAQAKERAAAAADAKNGTASSAASASVATRPRDDNGMNSLRAPGTTVAESI